MSKLERREFVKNSLMASASLTLLPGMLKGKNAYANPTRIKSTTVVFTNTTVVTGDANRAQLKDVALAVKYNIIADIGRSDQVLRNYPDAEVIDGRKKALLPGVVNCHAHLSASIAKGFNEDFGFPNRSGIKSPASLLSQEERTLMAVIA